MARDTIIATASATITGVAANSGSTPDDHLDGAKPMRRMNRAEGTACAILIAGGILVAISFDWRPHNRQTETDFHRQKTKGKQPKTCYVTIGYTARCDEYMT